MIVVTIALLSRYRPMWPSFHASLYVLHSGLVGKKVGGRAAIWLGLSNEFTSVMYSGNSTTTASTVRSRYRSVVPAIRRAFGRCRGGTITGMVLAGIVHPPFEHPHLDERQQERDAEQADRE